MLACVSVEANKDVWQRPTLRDAVLSMMPSMRGFSEDADGSRPGPVLDRTFFGVEGLPEIDCLSAHMRQLSVLLQGADGEERAKGWPVCEWEIGVPASAIVKTTTPFEELQATAWIFAMRLMILGLETLEAPTDETLRALLQTTVLLYWLGNVGETERCKAFGLGLPIWRKAFACNALGHVSAALMCVANFNQAVMGHTLASHVLSEDDAKYLKTGHALMTRSKQTMKNAQGRDDVGFALFRVLMDLTEILETFSLFYEALYYFFVEQKHMRTALAVMQRESARIKSPAALTKALKDITDSRARIVRPDAMSSIARMAWGSSNVVAVLTPVDANMFPRLQVPHASKLFFSRS